MTVSGTHSWLLGDPDAFGEAMTNVLGIVGLSVPADRHQRDDCVEPVESVEYAEPVSESGVTDSSVLMR